MSDERTTKNQLLARFLEANGRERRALFRELVPLLELEDVRRIACTIRDPSPKLSARVTALLARHGLREEFEAQLPGLKPGKIDILRRHFGKIYASGKK